MAFGKSIKRISRLSGIEPRRFFRSVTRMPGYLRGLRELRRQAGQSDAEFPFGDWFPILDEKTQEAGSARGHYFHQDLLIAQRVFEQNPQRHIDVGSRIDGFVAHVAAFRPIEVLDVRRLESTSQNIQFLQADLMDDLPEDLQGAADSVSCLHVIEHFGLGRYGDPINFEGHLQGIKNLRRMVTDEGRLYLSTPISMKQRIEFNAHRVFSVPYLREALKEWFDIVGFSFVDDSGNLTTEADVWSADAERTWGFRYGCGIFELTPKKMSAAKAA